jgi:hypothetical protein
MHLCVTTRKKREGTLGSSPYGAQLARMGRIGGQQRLDMGTVAVDQIRHVGAPG